MRIIRFQSGGKIHFGQPVDEKTARRIEGDILGSFDVTTEILPIQKLLAPLVPADIFCIGLNYRDHAAESKSEIPKNPMLFIKGGNTLNNPNEAIPIPKLSSMIDFEGELVIVFNKAAKDVSRKRALEHVLGYTIGNDVTARDWQRDKSLGGGQFARGKSFDGFCPLGPWIVTKDEIPDPNKLGLRTTVNGQVMQDHTTSDMIFDVPALIESLSSTLTLRPGSILMTGTPHGVGFARTPPVWLKDGDSVEIEIEKIGRLQNSVRNET